MQREIQLQHLFELLVKASIKLDKISRELNSEFSILESYVLATVAEQERCQAKQIVQVLGVGKSALSKVFSNLIKRKYIQEKPDAQDKRGKLLQLTEKGIAALTQDISLKNKQVMTMTKNLSEHEREQLTQLLSLLSDGFQAIKSQPTKGKSHLRAEVERLTRAAGFLGENLLETNLSYQVVEVLLHLGSKKETATSALVEALPFDKTIVSRLVKKLCEERLVNRRTAEDDGRVLFLSLSPKGLSTYEALCMKATNTLSKPSEKLTGNERETFSTLLSKITQ